MNGYTKNIPSSSEPDYTLRDPNGNLRDPNGNADSKSTALPFFGLSLLRIVYIHIETTDMAVSNVL
ncbi:MAG: hypothetical protein ACFNUH_00040 [Bacteroidota bacterium]